MSSEAQITDHLDLWTGATTKKSKSGRGSNGKIEQTGVKKLRELILALAIRGRLIEQSPNDEPAQELLKQCREAKKTAIEQGKLKKARRHAPLSDDDIPFILPRSWSWSRLDDLVRVLNGRAYKKHEMLSAGTPLLRVGNLFTSNDWYYSDLELEEDKYIDSGDLIYAWSASFGPFIWDGGRAIYHYHIWKLDLFDQTAINKQFLYLYLKAVTEEIKSSGSGIAMIHMTKAKMEELLAPIPPLEEQNRIVQKVDELMALCDCLEQQTSDQIAAHDTLVDTLLGTLSQSQNATELAENWTRLAAHFDTLFTTEQSIDKLKQTVLQQAVMGRLVEQDAKDEPSDQLLDRIATTMMKSRNSRRTASKQPKGQTQEDRPFKIPSNWIWAPLHETGLTSTGKTPSTKIAAFFTGDIPFIGPGQITASGEITKPEKFLSEEGVLYSDEALPDDILTVCIGGSIGKAAKVVERCGFNQQLNKIRPVLVEPNYILAAINAEFFQNLVHDKATGSATPIINCSKWESISIPLPPLAEQKRIVQKVDELMTLCDQLKERLNQSSETRCQLAETIVKNALQ